MVGPGIEVEATTALDLLHGVEDRVSGDEVLGLLGERLVGHEKQAFATGGFGQWAPLSPATLAAKNGGRILVNTGRLEQAMTSGARVDGDSVGIPDDPVARFMRAGANGAPKRNPTPEPSTANVRSWADDAGRFLAEGTR